MDQFKYKYQLKLRWTGPARSAIWQKLGQKNKLLTYGLAVVLVVVLGAEVFLENSCQALKYSSRS